MNHRRSLQDCVKRMLTRDPKKRLTAADLLKHPWMRINGVASDVIITPEVRAPPPSLALSSPRTSMTPQRCAPPPHLDPSRSVPLRGFTCLFADALLAPPPFPL